MSITIKIDEEDALEMLMDRLAVWNTDDNDGIVYDLYHDMYESYIDNGCFDGTDFDVMSIVDNDWVNWCSVIEPGDGAYEGICELYEDQGLGDISCEHEKNGGYSFIEAETERHGVKYFLVRS